ncbi:MAG: dipeptidase PepE [Acidobacteriota bacterium]
MPLRALLFSNSTNHGSRYLAHGLAELRDFLGSVRTLLFAPFALKDRAGYTGKVRAALAELGITVVELTADASGQRALQVAEAVFVGGGNTFRLLATLQEFGLLAPLRERALAGLPYIGSSAGTNLAGPTIKTTNDMPIVMPRDYVALGLVPFQINPHYLDANPESRHMGETREERLEQFLEENETPVVGLREGCWIRREGESVVLGGQSTTGRPAGRVFRPGLKAEERQSGSSLADLGHNSE